MTPAPIVHKATHATNQNKWHNARLVGTVPVEPLTRDQTMITTAMLMINMVKYVHLALTVRRDQLRRQTVLRATIVQIGLLLVLQASAMLDTIVEVALNPQLQVQRQ